jgi:hypothetical protein
MDDIVKKILLKIDDKSSSLIIDSNIFVIDENKFREIKNIENNKKISFVDGGNLEILKSPSFSVFYNRVFFSTYLNSKKIKSKRTDFFTLITAEAADNKLRYNASCSGIDMNFSFDPNDPTLTSSTSRADISAIGNVIRRFAELKAADEIDTDYIVIDGSLDKKYTYEDIFLDRLKDKKILGFSKSNDLLTDNGNAAGAVLSMLKEKSWVYDIDKKNYFVKLSDFSKYVFRLQAIKGFEIDEALSILKENSKDLIFPGYPYGLIEADKFARVTEMEKKSLKMQLHIKLGEKIVPYLNNSNAHDLL